MAITLVAFVDQFSKHLVQIAHDEVGKLLGIPGEIEKLQQTVHYIQCFLADAEKKQINSEAIERWLMDLNDVMYDSDDIIDLYQIRAQKRLDRSDSPSFAKLGRGFSKLFSHHRQVSLEILCLIQKINSRLEGISERRADLGLIELGLVGSQNPISHPHVRQLDWIISHKTDRAAVQEDIVGKQIIKDTEMLVNRLIEEQTGPGQNVGVVAIVGVGGIGKSTLARKIFHDPRIQMEFTLNIWVHISEEVKEVELLKEIILQAGGHTGAAQEKSELVHLLKHLVQEQRFLLVLDDVCPDSQKVWDRLLHDTMIRGAHGSSLLITTRDEKVAYGMGATTLHHVTKMSAEDGWCLLIKQIIQDEEDSVIEELKDIGQEIVTKCDGLPLAIKTIGGMLCTKRKTIEAWKEVVSKDAWFIERLPADVHPAFYLSYEDLPSHLKQCFILCSFYPKTYMSRQSLIYIWFAEGLLQDNENLWELGTKYYRELLLRNLLEASGNPYDQFECKMHDVLWSFSCYLGKYENLILRRDGEIERESSTKLRRLLVDGDLVKSEVVTKEKWLRTLLIDDISEHALDYLCRNLSKLRILDLSSSNISILPNALSHLIHLRHLDVSNSNIITVPAIIGELRNLVFLNFRNCIRLSHIPPSITNLRQLRYLSIAGTRVKTIPVGLKSLKKLVHLYGFTPYNNNLRGYSSLDELEALSQLVVLHLYGLERVSEINIVKKAKLQSKLQMQKLLLDYTSLSWGVSQTDGQKMTVAGVLNELSPPRSLEYLEIRGYFGSYLPDWLNLGAALPNLRFLDITDCDCFEKPASLGQLPNLKYLRIEGADSVESVSEEFLGRDSTAITIIPPFPELDTLVFSRMLGWKEWLWNKGELAMPKLKNLKIMFCPQLSSLPEGLLHHATSLENLLIKDADNLETIENFLSIKNILVSGNPNLKNILNLPTVSHIEILRCPNLKHVENLNRSLQTMVLEDAEIEALPKYLMTTMPQLLRICCSKELLEEISRQGNSEWLKFKHIPKVKIYARDKSLYATYQKMPFSFTNNVNPTSFQPWAPSGGSMSPLEETAAVNPSEEQMCADDEEEICFTNAAVADCDWKCLENVKASELEDKANSCNKPEITSVLLHWTNFLDRSGEAIIPDYEVLQKLKPHSDLQNLILDGYAAREFTPWFTKVNLNLPNLVQIKLCNLAKCDNLPPLGQLQNLRELQIWNLPNLRKINSDFCGVNPAFPRLTLLQMGHMLNLEEWRDMPPLSLNKLEVIRCPKLVFKPFLQGSIHCTIEESPKALSSDEYSGLSATSYVNYLRIRGCELTSDGWSLLKFITGLKDLVIDSCQDISTLPENMKHLTSLESIDITSCKNIALLPEWLSDLSSLQVLHVYECYNLSSLPNCMKGLSSLKTLRIINCSSILVERCMREDKIKIAHIPSVFIEEDGGEEIYWNTLTNSNSSEENSYISEENSYISEENSNSSEENLPCDYVWKCLESVKSTELAEKADLCKKSQLRSLTLQWTTFLDRAGEEIIPDYSVLKELQPHSNLEQLNLDGYVPKVFPPWVMDIQFHLSNLVQIKFWNLATCDHLPPLGKLNKLKEVHIQNLPNLRKINSNFCGGIGASLQLEHLSLIHIINLEEWEVASEVNGGEDMLFFMSKLEVIRCPKLVFKPRLPRCENCTIEESPNALSSEGYTGLFAKSSLDYLKIRDCELSTDGWQRLKWVVGLKELVLDSCQELRTLPESIRSLTSLESFDITSCKNVAWLPEWLGELSSLRVLHIYECYNLSSLPNCMQLMSSLKTLRIINCSSSLVARCIGEDKIKIAHIPSVFIEEDGGQEIYWNNFDESDNIVSNPKEPLQVEIRRKK